MFRTLMMTIAATLALVSCTQEETYPVSGEECGPDDPVRTLDASDCAAAPVPGSGGF